MKLRDLFRIVIRLVARRQGRERLGELLRSFEAAQEALEAGDVDGALDRLDDGPAEALLAEVVLDGDEELDGEEEPEC
jgi:hypothetical protein